MASFNVTMWFGREKAPPAWPAGPGVHDVAGVVILP
jgi:hypothetical protein